MMCVKKISDVYVLFTTLIYILTVILCTAAVEIHELKPPSSDFSRHSTVQPVILHGRSKREISTTKDESGSHHPEVTMKVPLDDEELILDLRLNQDLLTNNHVLTYQKNGKTVVHTPKKEELDLCQYGGSVRDRPGSWVAVSTCHGVQGIVFDGEKMRFIQPAQGDGVNGKHYVYASTDLTKAIPRSFHPAIVNNSYVDMDEKKLSRAKRYASGNNEIRVPYNANKNSRYVELVLVADYGLFEENGRDVYAVHRQMKDLANIINALYSPLNIFVALVGVEVWYDYDKIRMNQDSGVTLDNFLEYRSTNLLKRMPHDNAHLITTQEFLDRVVGKAHTGKICSLKQSGGIESYQTDVTGLLAMAIAHEMGHNLGMHHDEEVEDCECRDEHCIMGFTSSNKYIPVWSTCSLNALAFSFSKGLDYCLKNKPERLFDSPTCGNGFVEPGEQCDCGTTAVPGAYNPCHACCDPNTCVLRANATCGAGMCCDLQTCRPKSAGTVCRSAERECDLPEYCTGDSEYCPDDVYKMDTTPCGQGEQSAYCMRGECRSHSVQCRLLWGPTGKSSHEKCYSKNTQGDKHGDCGYDFLEDRYSACHTSDVMCGRLQCKHLSVLHEHDLQFGSGSSHSSSYQDGDTVGSCYTVAVDLGARDIGLVPDGAKCGDDMMCLNQRCLPVAAVRETMATSICPSNCSGHGVCDSSGHCQCEHGYDGPLCAIRRQDNSNNRKFNYRTTVITPPQTPTTNTKNRPGTNSQNPNTYQNTRTGIRNSNRESTRYNNDRPTTRKPAIYNNNIPTNRQPTRNNNVRPRPTNRQPTRHNNIRPTTRQPARYNDNRYTTRQPFRYNDNRHTTRQPSRYNNNRPINWNINSRNNFNGPVNRNDNRLPNTFNGNRPGIRPTNNVPVIWTNSQNPTATDPNRPGIRNNYRQSKELTTQEPDVDASSTDSSNWMVALYVFLGIIPLILLTLFLMYYFRRNLFKQYKDIQRKISIKSSTFERRRQSIPKPNSQINTISADLSGPTYINKEYIKTHKTANEIDGFPEDVVQKIRDANNLSNVFKAKETTGKVVRPKLSPPVKPKPNIHLLKNTQITDEVKDAKSKPSRQPRMHNIESSSL